MTLKYDIFKILGYLRANHAEYTENELSQAITNRLKLQNVYLKQHLKYKKQRNLCVTLLRKKKAKYFNDLELNLVRDNKMFWKTTAPYFVNNLRKRSKNTLAEEKDNTLFEDKKIAETFNKFFREVLDDVSMIQDANITVFEKYKQCSSILKIRIDMELKIIFIINILIIKNSRGTKN